MYLLVLFSHFQGNTKQPASFLSLTINICMVLIFDEQWFVYLMNYVLVLELHKYFIMAFACMVLELHKTFLMTFAYIHIESYHP